MRRRHPPADRGPDGLSQGVVRRLRSPAGALALTMTLALATLAHQCAGAALKLAPTDGRSAGVVDNALDVSAVLAEGRTNDGRQGLRRLRMTCPGSNKSATKLRPDVL